MYREVNQNIDLSLEEQEDAVAFEHERQRDEALNWEMCELARVEAAVAGGATLQVFRVREGFEIVLRLKDAKKSLIVLHSRLKSGGLFTRDGSVIFYPYEFSMHKYQHKTETRAATEYVRRKFSKVGA